MNTEKYFIGIDPGVAGGIVCLDDTGAIDEKLVMPIIKIGKRNRLNGKVITKWFKSVSTEKNIRMIALEEQRPMHKAGEVATFGMGRGFGMLEGILIGLDLPYEIIRPIDWQKEMFKGKPKGNTKVYSKEIAQQLFPKEDFKKSDRCTNLHDGLTDATLICEYIRRKIK